jgi:hypothetical protein
LLNDEKTFSAILYHQFPRLLKMNPAFLQTVTRNGTFTRSYTTTATKSTETQVTIHQRQQVPQAG